jgi:Cu-Zn family superoxide dismutase
MDAQKTRKLGPALALCAGMGLFACTQPVKPTQPDATAKATIEGRSGSSLTGEATFRQSPSGVIVRLQVNNAPPGMHGVHVHEKGDCSDIEAKSAGPHFNPTNAPHGGPGEAPHHAGDLGNLNVGADGTGVLEMTTSSLTIADGPNAVAQRAIVVHEKTDDLQTQPTGSSGGRIGCGVIELSKTPPPQ